MSDKNHQPIINPNKTTQSTQEDRPRKGLEDWEMLQTREEPPLKVPYWFIALVSALILGAVLLSFPLMGTRSGFERPWLDWGLAVGVGYGLISLVAIYFFLKNKKSSNEEQNSNTSHLNK